MPSCRRGTVACVSSEHGGQHPRCSIADLRHRRHHEQSETGNVRRSRQSSWLASVREHHDDTPEHPSSSSSSSIECQGMRGNFNGIELTIDENPSVWLKYVKIYLVNAIKLCQFNPAGDEHDGFGPSVKRSRLPLWSRLADLFWLYFSIKLVVLQILQHQYSLIMYELKVANERVQHELTPSATNNQTTTSEIRSRLDEVVARIELVGNPLYELGFALEALIVFVLFIVYIAKVQTPLRAATRAEPARIGLVQMLLDPGRERTQTTQRQIEQLVGKFLASNNNYWLVQSVKIRRMGCVQLGAIARPLPGLNMKVSSCLLLAKVDKTRTERIMLEMLASGELVPANRHDAWLTQVAKIYLGLAVFFTCLGIAIITIMLIILPAFPGAINIHLHTSARDLLTHVELICFCLVGLQWVIFYLILVIAVALDQLKFVGELRRSIASLIDDIYHEHYRAMATTATTCKLMQSNHGDRLNRRLLRVLVQYKLFKQQLRASQSIVGFIGGHMVFLMLLLPVMGRLYVLHMSLELRLIHVACSLFFIICCDFLVLPNCMLHARCLDLFRELSSLLAHIDATAQQAGSQCDGTGGARGAECSSGRQQQWQVKKAIASCDYGHTVWLLRRELHLPELAVRRFATRAFFLRLTYASWLGVHFWCGLLLAPLLMRDTARLGSMGTPFAETLSFL